MSAYQGVDELRTVEPHLLHSLKDVNLFVFQQALQNVHHGTKQSASTGAIPINKWQVTSRSTRNNQPTHHQINQFY